jgi:hypothetical protein
VYKEPKEKSKPVPAPDWTYTLTDKSNKQYESTVKPAAKPSKPGGYMDSNVSKKDFGC